MQAKLTPASDLKDPISMNMVHSVISGIWHILITADSKSMCGSVFRNGHLSIVDCVCVCQHVLFVHLFIYSISLCWCVCCNRALVFFNVCMSSMCVCVRAHARALGSPVI